MDKSPSLARGHSDDLELALIDAVFSIRARYDHTSTANHPATGVPAIEHRWRRYRGDNPPDLHRLANADPEQLASVLHNTSVTAGGSKTSAVSEAASNLVEAGILTSAALRDRRPDAKRAYVRVRGLSWVTFSYFCMLLRVPDIKADTWITRFVGQSLERELSAHEAYDLGRAPPQNLTTQSGPRRGPDDRCKTTLTQPPHRGSDRKTIMGMARLPTGGPFSAGSLEAGP